MAKNGLAWDMFGPKSTKPLNTWKIAETRQLKQPPRHLEKQKYARYSQYLGTYTPVTPQNPEVFT